MNLTLTEWLLIGIFATVLVASILIVGEQINTFHRLGGMFNELTSLREGMRQSFQYELDGYANISKINQQLSELRHLEQIEKSSADINYRLTKLEREFESMNASMVELYSVNGKLEVIAEVVNNLYVYQKFERKQ